MNVDTGDDSDVTVEEWLAVVRCGGTFFLVLATVGELILDYARYDPEFSRSGDTRIFRNGLLSVTSENAPEYLSALRAQPIQSGDMEQVLSGRTQPDLMAFIDFDARLYVHSYGDLPLERYVPRRWHGALGDPRLALRARTEMDGS